MPVESLSNQTLERREPLQRPPSPVWLAGMWEVGGSMGFSFHTNKGHLYAYPYMKISDNNEDILHYLQHHLVSERMLNQHGNSIEWKLNGEKVVGVAEPMLRHAVRRREIIKAFIDWDGAGTREYKTAIAQDFVAGQGSTHTMHDYHLLVEDPEFLSGVIDGRGKVFCHHKTERGNNFDHFLLSSENLPLILALHYRYGGKCYTNVLYNEEGKVRSQAHTWEIESTSDIKKLVTPLKNNLRFPEKVACIQP